MLIEVSIKNQEALNKLKIMLKDIFGILFGYFENFRFFFLMKLTKS